jgi:hypothetical protein
VNASDQLAQLVAELCDAIDEAPVAMAFDNEGSGPFQAIVDNGWLDRPGPIREKVKRLRVALLDLEMERLRA